MGPGLYIAIGIVAGAGLGILISNAFIGIAVGAAAGIAWYYGVRAMAARRRP